jgi:hypothetical protein
LNSDLKVELFQLILQVVHYTPQIKKIVKHFSLFGGWGMQQCLCN